VICSSIVDISPNVFRRSSDIRVCEVSQIATATAMHHLKAPITRLFVDKAGARFRKVIKLANFRRKRLLLDFPAAWCDTYVEYSLSERTRFCEQNSAGPV
jgi:hypothetical protein